MRVHPDADATESPPEDVVSVRVLFMNASYSAHMLPPAPTFSPATFHDTDVSLDPSEEVWKIRPADAIRRLCSSAIARSRQPPSKRTCP